jgi:hypothetical protein
MTLLSSSGAWGKGVLAVPQRATSLERISLADFSATLFFSGDSPR